MWIWNWKEDENTDRDCLFFYENNWKEKYWENTAERQIIEWYLEVMKIKWYFWKIKKIWYSEHNA